MRATVAQEQYSHLPGAEESLVNPEGLSPAPQGHVRSLLVLHDGLGHGRDGLLAGESLGDLLTVRGEE